MDLPLRSTLPTLPDGSLDWRFLPGSPAELTVTPDAAGKAHWNLPADFGTPANSLLTWARANQSTVLLAAGVLLFVSLMGGRRR